MTLICSNAVTYLGVLITGGDHAYGPHAILLVVVQHVLKQVTAWTVDIIYLDACCKPEMYYE